MKRIGYWLPILCLAGCVAACAAPEVAPPPPTRTPDAAYAPQPTPAVLSSAAARIVTAAPDAPAPAPAAVPEPPTTSVPEPAARCITVNSQFGLSLRQGPNRTAERLTVLDDGLSFRYVEANPDGTWYRIVHPGGYGDDTWVFAEYAPLGPCTN